MMTSTESLELLSSVTSKYMDKHEVRTEINNNRATTNTAAIALTEQSQKATAEKNKQVQSKIKEKEFRSEIREFLKKPELRTSLYSGKDELRAEQILFEQYFAYYQFVDEFSLIDIPTDEVVHLIGVKTNRDNLKSNEEGVLDQFEQAEQLQTFVDQIKAEGLSNSAILARILAESETGGLMVPTEKLSEYRNHLKLLNSSSIPQDDKAELTRILDSSGFDITAEDSFQQFGKEILKSRTISESTKQLLIKEFKVRPVITGHDLKSELLSRHQLIKKRKSEISELNENLASLNEDARNYGSDLQTIRSELENPNLSETEKDGLEKEAEELQSAISVIEEQQQEIKDSKRVLVASTPKSEIQLGEANVSYEDELIRVQLPNSRNYLKLPIKMSAEDVTRSVNAYLIYEEFEKRGLHDIVFPDEKLQDGVDLPSSSMMNFVNQMLDAIGMSRKDEILTLKNLEEFNRYLDCFSPEEAKGNRKLERDEFKKRMCDAKGNFLEQHFTGRLREQFMSFQSGLV